MTVQNCNERERESDNKKVRRREEGREGGGCGGGLAVTKGRGKEQHSIICLSWRQIFINNCFVQLAPKS